MASSKVQISWEKFRNDCFLLGSLLKEKTNPAIKRYHVYGIPTGGCFVAQNLCYGHSHFFVRQLAEPKLPETESLGLLVVDDLVDSGDTMLRVQQELDSKYPNQMYRIAFASVYRKHKSPDLALALESYEGWLHFPWEQDHSPFDAVTRLLQWIGEDPKRDGLRDTPKRVIKALSEMTCGYHEDPKKILGRVFDETYDEIVVLRNIPFTSLCEHHMLVFSGTVDIGYLPSEKRVVGLSKLARLVDCFANRLQVQERLTREIANSIGEHLAPKGVGVVVRASHSCMACRGVRKPGSEMVTSSMLGAFRDNAAARLELLNLFSS